VALKLERAAGAVVRGAYGFAASPESVEPGTATFRIRWTSLPAGEGGRLLEATLTWGGEPDFEKFELRLPEDRRGAAQVVFEVEFAGPQQGGSRPRAAWIDPVVEEREASRLPPEGAPSLLLITADTTRQDVLGPYGGVAPTPALDALADDGIVFDHGFSVAFGTTPSHASLFSASHAAEHGVYDNRSVVGPGFVTLAEVFHDAGYETAAFVSAVPVTRALGFSQGFDTFDDFLGRDRLSGLGRLSEHQRRADLTTDRFLAWLAGRRSEPFFAWIHFYDPHQPYSPPEPREPELAGFFEEGDGTPKLLLPSLGERNDSDLLERVRTEAVERYRAEVSFMDAQIGRVLRNLRERGLYDGMTIAFVADHGENLSERGDPLTFYHQGLYAGVARLPLILKLGQSRYAGSRQEILFGNLDIAPTLLDLAGLEAPAEWAGRSFRRHLGAGDGRPFRPYLVLEGGARQEISVRTREWMYRSVLGEHASRADLLRFLGYRPGRPRELYDLRADPGETTALNPGGVEAAQGFERIVDEFLATRGDVAGTVGSTEHLEALKTLGYVE